jgi:DNA-binding transcriptional regulator YiaG
MSQAAFAERMGVRQATVSDWETGKQSPSPMARRLLDRIAGAGGEEKGSLQEGSSAQETASS